MVNRSGDIGTKGETAVVKFARRSGFEAADRLPRRGTNDGGDVALCPGVMVQVKAGHEAEDAAEGLIGYWLGRTEGQRVRGGFDLAFLVRKRHGAGYGSAGRWYAHLSGSVFVWLATELEYSTRADLPSVALSLADALLMLRRAGYGSPLGVGDMLPVLGRKIGALAAGFGEAASNSKRLAELAELMARPLPEYIEIPIYRPGGRVYSPEELAAAEVQADIEESREGKR